MCKHYDVDTPVKIDVIQSQQGVQ